MTEKPNVQLVVSHLDGQTCYYPAGAGWRVDPRDRCLVIGRGLPRKHIPLDTVASFDIEEIGAEILDEPDPCAALAAKLIAELTRLDTVASERRARADAQEVLTSIVEAGVAPAGAGAEAAGDPTVAPAGALLECSATFAGEGSMRCDYATGHERIIMLDREWDHGNVELGHWWNEPELLAAGVPAVPRP